MDLKKAIALTIAESLFRKKYWDCVFFYEADPCEASRARWTKKEVMQICRWPYPGDWSSLRKILEKKVGLIMYMPGSGIGSFGRETARPWTFATCQADREWSVTNAAAHQIGSMKRTAGVMSAALTPGDERHALDEGSKARIDEGLKKHDVKLDKVLQTLQDVRQNLLDERTMKLLAEYGE